MTVDEKVEIILQYLRRNCVLCLGQGETVDCPQCRLIRRALDEPASAPIASGR